MFARTFLLAGLRPIMSRDRLQRWMRMGTVEVVVAVVQ